jgi:hypothetical protein
MKYFVLIKFFRARVGPREQKKAKRPGVSGGVSMPPSPNGVSFIALPGYVRFLLLLG